MAAEPLPPPAAEPTGDFRRWRWWKRWFGQRGERAAAKYLRTLGYRILAANVADTQGELDLLALDGDTLVVVEVRSTSSDRPDAIEQTAASVDGRKQRRVCRAATRFLADRRLLGKIALRYGRNSSAATTPGSRYASSTGSTRPGSTFTSATRFRCASSNSFRSWATRRC